MQSDLDLFIKYMAHVGAYEGTFFIPRFESDGFSEEEVLRLLEIADEAEARYIES